MTTLTIPARLTLFNATYLTEGATTTVYGYDDRGVVHKLMLTRRIFVDDGDSLHYVPARFSFDGVQVEPRSAEEDRLLALLEQADVASPENAPPTLQPGSSVVPHALILGQDLQNFFERSVEEALDQLRDQMVSFIRSDAYSGPPAAVSDDPAADGAAYDVWVRWEGRDRKKTISRIANAFQIGVRRARQLIDEDQPILRAARAPVVNELIAKLRPLGLGVRSRPDHRWIS
jgi:DNA segregation ATPase FtsK/SpoIIIE-like protein